jgi:hypothetical protein
MLAVIALLATIGAVAAGIAYRKNMSRAARYAADPSCQSSLIVAQGSCTTEPATITAQWIKKNRGSRYYRLAMRTTGSIDSVELKGANDKAVWNASPVGSLITAQRFAYPETERPRVTLIAVNSLSALTAWNPAWQEKNTKVGMWFLGIIALLSSAMTVARVLRRASPHPPRSR